MLNKVLGPIVNILPENNRFERIWKLAQLDFKKRYYHDNLGIFWSLLQPLFRIGIYYFVFKVVMNFERMPNYGLFIFSGIIFWSLFLQGTNNGKMILKRKRYLIENIKVKKIDLFLSDALSNLMSFGMTFIAYTLVSYYVGIYYSLNFFLIFILILNLQILAMGGGMILAVLYIFLKDIDHLWDVFRLFLFWTSGVFLRGEKFLEFFPPFAFINPLVSIFINVRSIIFFLEPVDYKMMAFTFVYGLVILALGNYLFNKYSDLALESY